MAITLFSKNEHLASEYFVTTLLMSTITDCCLITLSSSNLDCGGSQTWTSVWTNLIMISRNWEKQLWNWHLKTAPFTNDSLFQWIHLYRYTCSCLVYKVGFEKRSTFVFHESQWTNFISIFINIKACITISMSSIFHLPSNCLAVWTQTAFKSQTQMPSNNWLTQLASFYIRY